MYVTLPPATVLVGVPGDPLEIDGGELQIPAPLHIVLILVHAGTYINFVSVMLSKQYHNKLV